ncbi:MAG: tRNA (adenosine(37)-N6)-dimethylallyltransferase MiaA [Candidatus Saccharimonadales bacterium]
MNKPLVVIVGPTASGKSDLAMQMALKHNGEIICADSRTVYKGMDIGTAKPSAEDQAKVRHHLVDLVEPNQHFSAAEFKKRAEEAIRDIHRRGKLPIMVGGTGLYVDAVIFNYQFGPPTDPELRAKLQALSIEKLQELCREKNIKLPENISNKRHLIRAIELGGLIKAAREVKSNTFVVGMAIEKKKLRDRIIERTAAMVREGILEEVEKLGAKYGWESEAMTGNIYRIFKGVVLHKKPLQTAIEEFIRADMKLAKRQMTWFKRNPFIVWGSPSELAHKIDQFVGAN